MVDRHEDMDVSLSPTSQVPHVRGLNQSGNFPAGGRRIKPHPKKQSWSERLKERGISPRAPRSRSEVHSQFRKQLTKIRKSRPRQPTKKEQQAIRRLPDWQREQLRALEYYGWPWYRIRSVWHYLTKQRFSIKQLGTLKDITFLLNGTMLPLMKSYNHELRKKPQNEKEIKKLDEDINEARDRYREVMEEALKLGLRNHPLVYEWAALRQLFGDQLEVRDKVGNTRRRIKKEADRQLTTVESLLYLKIIKMVDSRRYRSWTDIQRELRKTKNNEPWNKLLRGKSKQSFHKLRIRLGLGDLQLRHS